MTKTGDDNILILQGTFLRRTILLLFLLIDRHKMNIESVVLTFTVENSIRCRKMPEYNREKNAAKYQAL